MKLETRLRNEIIINSLIRKGIIDLQNNEIKFRKVISSQTMFINTDYDKCSAEDRDKIHSAYQFNHYKQVYELKNPELLRKVHNYKMFIDNE